MSAGDVQRHDGHGQLHAILSILLCVCGGQVASMVGCGRGEVGWVCRTGGGGGGRVLGGEGVGVCGGGGCGGGLAISYAETKGMIRSGGGERQADVLLVVGGSRGVGVRWGGCGRQVVGVGGGRNQVVGGGGGFRGCPGLLNA